MGARHICDSRTPDFRDSLIEARAETGATLAFDAIGGGSMTSDILTCMEAADNRSAASYSPFGSQAHKQVYIYGGLDRSPIAISSAFGLAWGVGGWLMTSFRERVGREGRQAARDRVVAGYNTTFASHFNAEISLAEMLQPDTIAAYSKFATGEKYLVRPNTGLDFLARA